MEVNNEKELFEKKMAASWGSQTKEQDIKDNFAISNELTVTITLNEYRNLVRTAAAGDIRVKDLENQKSKLYSENCDLKKQLEALKEVLRKPEEDKDNEDQED